MKKVLLATVLALLLAMTACESSSFEAGATTRAQYVEELGVNGVPKPLWTDGIIEDVQDAYPDYIIGVGSAKLSTERATRRSAETRARAAIVETAKAEVEDRVIDSLQDAGDDIAQQALIYFEEDILSVAKASVVRPVVLDTWEALDGTLYLLMGCDADNVTSEFERLLQAELARQETYENLERQAQMRLF